MVWLPPAAQLLLDSKYPGFRAWQVGDYAPWITRALRASGEPAPSAVLLDLNDDGRRDAFVAGHTATEEVILVFLSSTDAYEMIEWGAPRRLAPDSIIQRQGGYHHRITYHRLARGVYEGACSGRFELRADGVESNFDEKGTTVIYFEDAKLHEWGLNVC
jgi:hypothetical protein